jgi:hypothetical protein
MTLRFGVPGDDQRHTDGGNGKAAVINFHIARV